MWLLLYMYFFVTGLTRSTKKSVILIPVNYAAIMTLFLAVVLWVKYISVIIWLCGFLKSPFFFFDLTLNTHSVLNRLACVQLHSHLNKGNCCVLNTKNFHKSARSEYSYLSIFLRNNWIFKDLIVSLGKSWTPLVFFSLKKWSVIKTKQDRF